MSESPFERILLAPLWRSVILGSILLLTGGLSLLALLAPTLFSGSALTLKAGDVASQDILAPIALSYQSQVLTEQSREAAAQEIGPIYSPHDTRIARQQVERLRAVLAFITNTRADSYATQDQILQDLSALEDIQFDQTTAEVILGMSSSRWQAVQQESIVVLEQVMRNTIRETGLEQARRSVLALVSLSIPEDQARVVAELAAAFVAPNSLYNEQLTEAARQQAREAVVPVTRSFSAGETIVERGQRITPASLEAMERFGLLETANRWQDLASASALVILTTGFIVLYLRFQTELTLYLPNLAIISSLYLIFLFGARLTLPGHTVLPYLYPLPAFSLVVAALFGTRYGLVFGLPLSVMVSYGMPNGLGLTMYYLMGSLFGVLLLGRAQRVSAFIWAGAAVAVTSAATVSVYFLPDPTSDLVGVASLSGASILNGIASGSLAILIQFFLAQLLGLTTALQLLEISRPDNPLLQFVLRNAPGTYQHSLQVANLAEQAAERIGADALLTRVGALYHDAGKALNPYFFIENQPPGFANPHDDLAPFESAQIIIRHVSDGLELARKYKLPGGINDFILQHHGTLLTRYQYVKAVQAADGDEEKVNQEDFRYPGPRPQSRETALVMLADGCEARARAEAPKTEDALRALVKDVIDSRLAESQLDQTNLTTKDLSAVVETFTSTLRGVYHPRIDYPKLESRPAGLIASPANPDPELPAESLTKVDSSPSPG